MEIDTDKVTLELSTIFLNNAIKYSPDGGVNHCQNEDNWPDLILPFLTTVLGFLSRIYRIFDRFYRVDRALEVVHEGGTGL